VRFVDFLKATVLLCAASATFLATLTVVTVRDELDASLMEVAIGWWLAAAAIGAWLGRRNAASPPIARLLADARMPIGAAALGVFVPQVSAVAAGFAIIWALAWRRQEAAVAAIEDRDGFRFYVDRTPPFQPIRLIRTPGLRTG
jgi:hypothetical protein